MFLIFRANFSYPEKTGNKKLIRRWDRRALPNDVLSTDTTTKL